MYSNKNYFLTKIDEFELNKLTGNDDRNLESAIETADSIIDSYITNVTSIPMAVVPEMIKQLSYDIAMFSLHDRIQYSDIPDRVKDKYDAAIFLLKDIARGQANIPGLAKELKDEGINYEVNDGVFNRKSI